MNKQKVFYVLVSVTALLILSLYISQGRTEKLNTQSVLIGLDNEESTTKTSTQNEDHFQSTANRNRKKPTYTPPEIGANYTKNIDSINSVNGIVLDYDERKSSDGKKISRITVLDSGEGPYRRLRVEEESLINDDKSETFSNLSVMVADHVIVRIAKDLEDNELNSLLDSHGLKIRKKMYSKNMFLVKTPEAKIDSVSKALITLSNESDIKLSDPDYIVFHSGVSNDTDINKLWGMHNTGQTNGTPDADIDAHEAWKKFTGSKSVIVGVIDTGIDYKHPDLAANMWRNPGEIPNNGKDDDGNGLIDDVHGFDFRDPEKGDPMDQHFHGTHCAGTIGAVGNNGTGVAGVNWNVKLMALRFIQPGRGGSTSAAVECIDYATDNGVHVTSNSWSGPNQSQALIEAIERANAKNVLFVAAAGNNSQNSDHTPRYPANYDIPNVIAVAATDHDDKIAEFSNYSLNKVALGAPGVGIYSTMPNKQYDSKNGTSMATPHVAGACALLKGYNPKLTAKELKFLVMHSGDRIKSMEGATISGRRLNLNKMLDVSKKPVISIKKLNTYKRLIKGQKNTISWESLRVNGDLKIELISNARKHTITGRTANDGSYDWTPPANFPPGKYKLRVSSVSTPSISDEISTEVTVENFPKSLQGWSKPQNAQGTFTITNAHASQGNLSLKADKTRKHADASIQYTDDFSAGHVSFDVKISAIEHNVFSFYIDNVLQGSWKKSDWSKKSFPVKEGKHTFRWTFRHQSNSYLYDATAYIDEIQLPPLKSQKNTPPKIVAGAKASPSTVKLTESTSLSVKASDADNDRLTYKWQKVSGPGNVSFTSSNSDNASAKFSKAGQYRIKVIISDSKETVESFVNVTVKDTTVVAEKGSFLITQESRNQWHSVKMNKQYKSPVIIFSPVTYNGSQPAHIRVKNVRPDSFEWQIEEWDYLDGFHLAEKVDYIVLEAGTYKLEDGRSLVAGNVVSQDSLTSHGVPKVFKFNPIIVTQLVSAQDKRPATVRLNNIKLTSFDIKLQSEEAYNKVHGDEIVSYIAVEPGQYEDAGLLEAEVTGFDVGSNWFELQFSQTYEQKPSLFASFQTSRGNNTVDLRIRNLDNGSVDAIAQEEQSKDEEVFHLKEKLGYILFNLDKIKK